MLDLIVIGNVAAEPVTQSKDGREFTTFRVAHNESYTDQAGQEHRSTQWVDVILSNRPPVCDYIKAGTHLCARGRAQVRVYSSPKDRCMKAGITISNPSIELVGGAADPVPRDLVDANGVLHRVEKYYHTDVAGQVLYHPRSMAQFGVDDNGWVMPMAQAMQDAAAQAAESQAAGAQQAEAQSAVSQPANPVSSNN